MASIFIEGPVKFTCLPRVDEDEKCHPGLPEHCTDGLYCADTSFDNIFDIDLDGKCRPLPAMDEQCGDAPGAKCVNVTWSARRTSVFFERGLEILAPCSLL